MSLDLKSVPKPFFILAPMDDVTDTVFRQVVDACAAPDLYFTEFVNVDGLQSPGRERVFKKLLKVPSETTLVAQIWGKNPENFYKTAYELASAGYVGVDINMGCPDKTVVKNGCCSALINNRELAGDIIRATQKGVADGAKAAGVSTIPVSVKTRLGFSQIDFTWHEFLLGFDLDMLTVHLRTRAEMSLVPAHWGDIVPIRELRDKLAPRTLLVGNGDVESRAEGLELAKQYGLDGIMVGRGVFHDPYCFSADSPWESITPVERLQLYKKHIELFADTWQHDERRIHTLNKFCKIYVNGFDNAKELREQLMDAGSAEELLGLVDRAIAAQAVAAPATV